MLGIVVGLLVVMAGSALAVETDGVGVVDGRSGEWYLRDAATGSTTHFYYGNPGDVPFMGDWDCDGVETPGLYRQRDGFVYLRNSNTQGIADIKFYFGDPGDIPIPGDFSGDGCDTVSIYRPSQTRVYIVNALGSDSAGLGAADFFYTLGNPGDKPVVGDFDGDGIDSVGLHRASTNSVYIMNHLTAGPASSEVSLGQKGDLPVAGAWGTVGDSVATYRPATGTFFLPASAGSTEIAYGSAKFTPIAGAFGPLPGGDEPPPSPPPYPEVGSGKRIIYSNSAQRIWLIDANEQLVDTYLVSGRVGIPHYATYKVFSKSVNAWAPYGGITMKHMVRFVRPGTWGNQWSYGFHAIPRYSNGQPMQTEEQLGTHRSGGCVRQADYKALALYNWAPIGTTVHAIP